MWRLSLTISDVIKASMKEATMEPKKLRRSTTDKVIAGVCGGVGNYFDVDPVLIRVIWALCCAVLGTGLLAYIICAIVIPSEDNYSSY